MQIEGAPHGYVIQIFYFAAIVVSYFQIDEYLVLFIVDDAYYQPVGGGLQGIAYIFALYAAAQSVLAVVIYGQGFAFGFPVVLYRVRVYGRELKMTLFDCKWIDKMVYYTKLI